MRRQSHLRRYNDQIGAASVSTRRAEAAICPRDSLAAVCQIPLC
ncbi:hypothetical protein OCAR_4235 [Afipia carboxidovorans OM5]|nr:hypothetical protein OCAR_4235 [Afipia carboxidovorans OM5]